MRTWMRAASASVRLLVVATITLGVVYPAVGVGLGWLMPHQADGSLVVVDGQVVGSALLGQEVTGEGWFFGRPSASAHDAMASGGSNLGPNSQELVEQIRERQLAIAAREGVDVSAIPADAVTASASGLDPDISPAYAALQVPRVARERGLDEATVAELVQRATTPRGLGFLGEEGVNVTVLNASLASLG